MHVTISIINFNYGRYLKQAIESALFQKVHDDCVIDVLIIDDGSTDESDEVVEFYRQYTNLKVSKTENRGFAASLTRAITEAKGEYVFLMDADDYFKDDKVSEMLPYFEQGSLYVTDTSSYIDKNGAPLSGGAWGSTSTVAVLKSAVMPLLPVENEMSFFSLHKLNRGIVLPESYTYYRFHDNSMTNRTIPGKWKTYLAGVSLNLSNRLCDISKSSSLPEWGASASKIRSVANEFLSQSYYNRLEASLECRQFSSAYKNYFLMMYWQLKAKKKISLFHLKMTAKTLMLRPSVEKNKS